MDILIHSLYFYPPDFDTVPLFEFGKGLLQDALSFSIGERRALEVWGRLSNYLVIVPLQRLRSVLTPDVNAFNAVEEKEGLSRKKLVIK